MKKIVLVVGHREKFEFGDKRIQGSASAEGLTEYVFNCELARKIKFYLIENHADKVTAEIVKRDGKRLIEMPKTVLALSPDVGVELHCNSSEGHIGHGREVLILDSPLARKKCGDLAEILSHRIGLALFNRDRGMVYRKHGTNGAVILTLGTNFPFVLLEPFFIDHPADCANALKHREELAVQIAEGLIDFLFQNKPRDSILAEIKALEELISGLSDQPIVKMSFEGRLEAIKKELAELNDLRR